MYEKGEKQTNPGYEPLIAGTVTSTPTRGISLFKRTKNDNWSTLKEDHSPESQGGENKNLPSLKGSHGWALDGVKSK